jgi:hypothetical protein
MCVDVVRSPPPPHHLPVPSLLLLLLIVLLQCPTRASVLLLLLLLVQMCLHGIVLLLQLPQLLLDCPLPLRLQELLPRARAVCMCARSCHLLLLLLLLLLQLLLQLLPGASTPARARNRPATPIPLAGPAPFLVVDLDALGLDDERFSPIKRTAKQAVY